MAYILAQAKGGSGGGITKVQIPSVVIGTYTYDGTAQGPTITGLDTTHCNVTGTTSATNAGSYTITISLKDPTTMIWNDISVADKVYTWSIGVRSVTVPTVTGTSFTYDGTTQGPTITDLDNNFCTITGDTTATNVGSYNFTVSLNNTDNCKWADDSTTAKTYSWSITAKPITIPTLTGTSLIYNGTAQGPTITSPDSAWITTSGDTTATNKGNYSVTFALNDDVNTEWEDGTTADKTFAWTIGEGIITVPTVTDTSLTYTGNSQGPTITGLDSDNCTVTGDVTATSVGSYSFVVSLNDPVNSKWEDDSTSPKTYSWSIAVKVVTVPTVSSTGMIYDGTEQSPTISNPDNAWNTMSGTSSATNAGSYSLTFALNDTVNCKWSDNTTAAKSYSWAIAKADINLVLEYTSVTLDSDHTSFPVRVSGFISGTLTAESSDTNIARVVTVSSGASSEVIIYSVDDTSGTATITVDAGETANYNGATATIAVTASFTPAADPVLDNNDWATIKAVAQEGTGANYWSVGDRKAVTINGTVGIYTFNSETYYAYILGFNHNQSTEGTAIHFQFGFDALSDGHHIAFCDSRYDSYNSSQCFNMNPASGASSSTNSGGWNSCEMRTTLIPAFISALPSALQSALKAITKYTDNTGNKSNVAANVTATSDKVFLLAEYEIFGSRTYANQYEHTDSKQVQYDYYENGNSKIMYNHTSTGSIVAWWERSPRYSDSTGFCSVGTFGTADRGLSGYSRSFAPGFAVG